MKWNYIIKNANKIGMKRTKTKFLLFPKCIDDLWRWLEIATYTQMYLPYYIDGHINFKWMDVSWED